MSEDGAGADRGPAGGRAGWGGRPGAGGADGAGHRFGLGLIWRALRREIAAIADGRSVRRPPAGRIDDVVIPVRYDGPDLDDVARLTGLTRAEVIARHTGTRWRAAFIGFAPGVRVPDAAGSARAGGCRGRRPNRGPACRRDRSPWPAGSARCTRTRLRAAGSSSAAPMSPLWDVDRDPPALIGPGAMGAVRGRARRSRCAVREMHAAQRMRSRVGALEVLRTGPAESVPGPGPERSRGVGVGRSGAADRSSYLAANRLLGNDDNAAAIECVLGGLSAARDRRSSVAVTGASVPVTVDGEPAARCAGRAPRRSGDQARDAEGGLRSYLAVRGGFDVPAVLGSRSTDTLSGLGPEAAAAGRSAAGGRATGRGGCGTAGMRDRSRRTRRPRNRGGAVTLRAMLGPRDDWFASAGGSRRR